MAGMVAAYVERVGLLVDDVLDVLLRRARHRHVECERYLGMKGEKLID